MRKNVLIFSVVVLVGIIGYILLDAYVKNMVNIPAPGYDTTQQNKLNK